jgi:hypothetical protein
MTGIYFKIIKFLSKQEYELKARYIPSLIFTGTIMTMIYFKYLVNLDLGFMDFLKIPLIILISLFITLVPKFCSTTISGYLQTIYWDKFGNPTIKYIKKSKNSEYKKLLTLFESDDKLLSNMLKITRECKLLFSKNIFYGFMRNFTFLILSLLFVNLIYFNYFIFENCLVFFLSFVCLYISSQRYSEQIIKSYIEIK